MSPRVFAIHSARLSKLGVCLAVAALVFLLMPTMGYAQEAQTAVTTTQTITGTATVTDTQPAAEAPAAAAAEAPVAAAAPQPRAQNICVEGSVIDHEEKLISTAGMVVSVDGPTPGTANVENGKFKFGSVAAGDHTFALDYQALGEGWQPITPDQFDVTLAYGQKGCYVIRFKLKQIIIVRVLKINDEHAPLGGWTIQADPGRGNVFAVSTKAVTQEDGYAVFYLTKGNWIFTEKAPAGVNYVPILPANGRQEANITGPTTLRFKNDIIINQSGCIIVTKHDDTEFPLPGWKIDIKRTNGTVAKSGVTDINGTVRFDNLPLGPYSVVEETRSGWAPTESNIYDVVLDSTQCVEVPFINRQSRADTGFCFEGRKIDTNGKVGLPGWVITIQSLDNGGYTPNPNSTTTDGLGIYRFTFPTNDYRIPGGRYKICEQAQTGWLPHTPTCYNVQLPTQAGACVKVRDFENQQTGHGRTTPGTTPGVGCRTTYTAQRGDGLFAVGARHGVSGQAMINANPWIRSRHLMYLRPGDQVCIP